MQSELQNEKKAHAADLSTLEQYKARENVVKMMQANYSGRDSSVNFETISVELENKIKDVEKTILRIAHAEKDFQLKEQNLFKSRERYMERLKANMKDKQTASFLELTNLQGRKEIEMIIHKAEQYQQLLEESEQMATHLLIQNKHLKEEIRNIERNETREKNFKNLEYLKNITLKYIQTHHEQLIPVIANLLQFSPEEMDSIKPNPSRPLSPKSPASPPSKSYFWF
uniref:GRIP domain-containing protein n=1 Tax=Arcella intermedia TaxID=1963864 RepID=A0A6B2LDV0_9EUKA